MKIERDIFLDTINENSVGIPKGIYSLRAANPDVLSTSFQQATSDGSILLAESTSNRINQFGDGRIKD